MKRVSLALLAVVTLTYSSFILSGTMESIKTTPKWTGFYFGGSLGYWESQPNRMTTTGSPGFISPVFELGASNIANALSALATNKFSFDSNGFLGEGQVGYLRQIKNMVFGLDTGFNVLGNSDNKVVLKKSINLIDFDEYYVGSLTTKQKIKYLGAMRARLGILLKPTILLYAKGGFAFGKVILDSAWRAEELLGPLVYPPITVQNHISKTLPGWTAGGGVECLFSSAWSVKIEYLYYSLSDVNAITTIAQNNQAISPPALFGSSAVKTSLSPSIGAFSIGLNYHF